MTARIIELPVAGPAGGGRENGRLPVLPEAGNNNAAANDSGWRKGMGMTRYPEAFVPRLSPEAADVFGVMNPSAFWIGGNLDGVQPVKFGDNRGRWPVRFGVTSKWKFDRAEKNLTDAFNARGLLLRYWVAFDAGHRRSWAAAERLHVAVYHALAPVMDKALSNYVALDPDVTLDGLDREVRAAALGLSLPLATDRDLAAHLEMVARVGAVAEWATEAPGKE